MKNFRPASAGWIRRVSSWRRDVTAVAIRIGKRRSFVEDASLDAAPQMLDEVAVDLRIDIVDNALTVDFDVGTRRTRLRAQNPGHGRQRSCK